MGNLANSYTGMGGAIAFDRGMSPERFAERSGAYALKEQRDQELRTLKATEPTTQDRQTMADAQTLELQNALETQKQMMIDNNKQSTFRAYERFDVDGDVRHINTMIGDLDSKGSKLFGQIARVDKLTENDRQMLEDIGVPSSMITEIINNPELNKSYVKYTKKDGTVEFGDLDLLKGLTGYTEDYATVREVTRQKTAREMEQLAAIGYDLDPRGREAFRRTRAKLGPDADPKSPEFQDTYTEMIKEVQEDVARGRPFGRAENQTESEAYGRRWAAEQGFYPGDPGYNEALNEGMRMHTKNIRPSSAMKNTEGAADAENELMEEGFFDIEDFGALSSTERAKIGQKIRTIEGPGGSKLSAADKTTLERIQRLTSTGAMASELTDDQTGIMDSILRTVKKYIFNDVEGIAAESAYSAYSNLVMHALYGASLQPGERGRFNKAFGSLGQQRGPVLAQLRVSLQEIKDAYQAVSRTNNEFVMKFRTGRTGSELQDVIDALDDRIEMIDNIQSGRPITVVTEPLNITNDNVELTPEQKAELSEIFK